MATILVSGGVVVTADAARRRFDPGAVVIEGDRIAWVGPAGEAQVAVAQTIDARRRIVMPGFVNAHTHSNEGFEQGAYDNLPLEPWLIHSYPPFGMPLLTEREHYLRAMVTAVESIRSGVTTVQDDVLETMWSPAAVDGTAKAYFEAGLRAVVTVALWDRGLLDCMPYARETFPETVQREIEALPRLSAAEQLDLFRRHHGRWHGVEGRLAIIPAPSSPERCSTGLLEEVARTSAEFNLPVHCHVLESKAQAVAQQLLFGKTLVERLAETGLLTRRLTMNHAIWLTELDMARMGEAGCSISHNPLSNLKLGSGLSPVRELLNAGINVALGTDGLATSDTADMVEAIRAAGLLHKIRDHDPDEWISGEEAFLMATRGGARSTGLGDQVGAIEVGRKADLVLLDADAWGFIPLNDPVRQLAFSNTSEAVRTVIVGGTVVMRDRRLTLIDEAALKEEVKEAAERFRRESWPVMQAGARRVAPHVLALWRRAVIEPVPRLGGRVRE